MIKNVLLIVSALLFVLFIPPTFYLLNQPQSVTMSSEKVVYDLPYPGLLPDHPLYIVKIVRDRLSEFFTRDYLKKAELYLLLSDKRSAMGLALAKKGKDKLTISALSKAEKYFLRIAPLLETSKKQGVSPSSDLINRVKLSNGKHREIEETLLKDLPQGNVDVINQILELNSMNKQQIEKL